MTAKNATDELWPGLLHPEAHWMVARSLATGIADPPLAVWASGIEGIGYLLVDKHLYIAKPDLDDADDRQSFNLSAKPVSAETWTAEMKSEAAPAGFGGESGLKTLWDFRCDDGEALKVKGEVLFRGRDVPGEANKAELFARQLARQLGWRAQLP